MSDMLSTPMRTNPTASTKDIDHIEAELTSATENDGAIHLPPSSVVVVPHSILADTAPGVVGPASPPSMQAGRQQRSTRVQLTAAEALAQANAEGLTLFRCETNGTGYYNVCFDNRKTCHTPYSISKGRTTGGVVVPGCFCTKEHAALAYARHLRDTGISDPIADSKRRTAEGFGSYIKRTVVCRTPSCGALVDLEWATRQARKANRASYALGDGCAGRACTNEFHSSRFDTTQSRMKADLQSGKRKMVDWPIVVLSQQEAKKQSNARRKYKKAAAGAVAGAGAGAGTTGGAVSPASEASS
jgi:hypothetical protein